jgi:hypothetical protein
MTTMKKEMDEIKGHVNNAHRILADILRNRTLAPFDTVLRSAIVDAYDQLNYAGHKLGMYEYDALRKRAEGGAKKSAAALKKTRSATTRLIRSGRG